MLNSLTYISGFFQLVGLYMLDSKNWLSFFPGSVLYSRVIYDNSNKDYLSNTFEKIKLWSISSITSSKISHHWWYEKLPTDIRNAFDECSNSYIIKNMFCSLFSPIYYDILPIPEMNEIYVTGEERKEDPIQSDRVFFISHIDGPFMWVPFVSVYRCLIGVNENKKITTHFPANYQNYKVNKGDFLAFDFNREIHYITSNNNTFQTEPRITLKAHYCIYPKWCGWLGRFMYTANAKYNQIFRYLFLKTIKPETWIDRINGFMVVSMTHLFVWLDMFIGYRNIYFLAYLYYLNYSKVIDIYLLTLLLYSTSIYKYAHTMCLSKQIHSTDLWSNSKDILIFYLLAVHHMFSYNVIV